MSFLLLGLPALGIALILTFLVGRSRRRVGIVLASGLALPVGWAVAVFVLASADQPCHDCGRYLGRYVDPVFFLIWLLNALGWTLGCLIGGATRSVTRS